VNTRKTQAFVLQSVKVLIDNTAVTHPHFCTQRKVIS